MMNSNHPYHLVTFSPWPLLMSFSIMLLLFSSTMWFYNFTYFYVMLIMFFMCLLVIFQWWRDVIRESTFQGFHTHNVKILMYTGMILFIISELMFFISFFWTFFHSSISPDINIGMQWPPKNIIPFNPYDIPLLNTIVLLTSGFYITWSHFNIINNDLKLSLKNMKLSIMLGIYFTMLQLYEYKSSFFSMSDSIYGSIFFMTTGFHGIHVIIGTIFLLIIFIRMKNNHFSIIHHFGFEAASWYWHFVDIIWLFVYSMFYWWNY